MEGSKTSVGGVITQTTRPSWRLFLPVLFFCATFSLLHAQGTYAATLGFSPAGQTVRNVDETFFVDVVVSSPEKAANAISGTIGFSGDLVDVISITESPSVISFWIQRPQVSGASGIVRFEGAALNPGYQGSAGRVLRLQLRATHPGLATLSFRSGSVLANDGQGTNIISGMGTTSILIQEDAQTPIKTTSDIADQAGSAEQRSPEATPSTPTNTRAPQPFSPTHPEPGQWYSRNDVDVRWTVPAGVRSVRVGMNKSAKGIPTRIQNVATGVFTASDVEDGVWYVHVQFQDEAGWGPVAHYPIRVDTHAPTELTARELDREDLTDPNITLLLSAKDDVSGVDRYGVSMDGKELQSWKDDGSHRFVLSSIGLGVHELLVTARDTAGNTASTTLSVFIDALEAPKVIDISREIQIGDMFVVRGVTRYPLSQVVLWMEPTDDRLPQHFLAQSDDQGIFSFALKDRLRVGTFMVSAEVVDGRGAKSARSAATQVVIRRILLTHYMPVFLGVSASVLACYVAHQQLRRRRKPTRGDVTSEEVVERRVRNLARLIHDELHDLELQERRRKSSTETMEDVEATLLAEHEALKRIRKRR